MRYNLIVALDSNAEIPESIETNNRAMFSAGVFQTANGTVMVHGTESADAIMVHDLFTTWSPWPGASTRVTHVIKQGGATLASASLNQRAVE